MIAGYTTAKGNSAGKWRLQFCACHAADAEGHPVNKEQIAVWAAARDRTLALYDAHVAKIPPAPLRDVVRASLAEDLYTVSFVEDLASKDDTALIAWLKQGAEAGVGTQGPARRR